MERPLAPIILCFDAVRSLILPPKVQLKLPENGVLDFTAESRSINLGDSTWLPIM
jgi:hypothetical protein